MMLWEFYRGAGQRAARNRERYGQAAFNHLLQVRKDLAEKVRGMESMDPFYISEAGSPEELEIWRNFCAFLQEHWEEDPSK